MSEKNPPEFYIKLRSDIVLKNIFRTYVLFTDDCDLICTPTRLIVKSISPDRASFLYIIIMKDDCVEYNTHESHSVEIKLDMFNKILTA